MSGGQTKNRALMQLMADVCGMGIVVPKDGKQGKGTGGVVDPVVLGAAILGRYADEATKGGGGRMGQAERLWGIMVCSVSSLGFSTFSPIPFFSYFPGRDDTHWYSHPSKGF